MKYLFCLFLIGCVTTDGTKTSAEANAAQWCRDMDIGSCFGQCSGRDSDQDGYVSCTVKTPEGVRIPLECGYYLPLAILGQNETCREPRALSISGQLE